MKNIDFTDFFNVFLSGATIRRLSFCELLPPHHLAAIRPHGHDVVPMGHVDGPLEPLPHRQRMAGLREVAVVNDHRVEPVPCRKAVSGAEIPVSRGGTQIVPPPAPSGSPGATRP